MVAVRAFVVVQRDGEDLAVREVVEDRRAAARPAQRVARRPGEAAQDGRLDEERPERRGQLVEHVAREVLANQSPRRPCPGQDPPSVLGRLAARREMEQLQPRGPALGPARERGQIGRRDRVPVEVAEQPFRLPCPEAQVVRPDLQQLPGDPEPRQVERRRDAGPDEDRQPRRRVLHEPAQRRLGRRALQGVQVVDDEHRRALGAPIERARGLLDRRPVTGDVRAARAVRAASRYRRSVASDRRPTSRRGTTRPGGPRRRPRTGRGAWTCRSPRARRRASAGGARRPRARAPDARAEAPRRPGCAAWQPRSAPRLRRDRPPNWSSRSPAIASPGRQRPRNWLVDAGRYGATDGAAESSRSRCRLGDDHWVSAMLAAGPSRPSSRPFAGSSRPSWPPARTRPGRRDGR